MKFKSAAAATIAAILISGSALAQTTPSHAPNATTTPATPKPTTRGRAATATSTPTGAKVDLNTATADQLDALPGIGPARVKAITTERAKGRFKDWADFETRMNHTSVNKGVRAKIKDQVTF